VFFPSFLSPVSFLFLLLLFFLLLSTGIESGIYRAKGSGGVPITALSLRMGSGVFLLCHGARRGGQWVWFAGHGFSGFSSRGGMGLWVLAKHAGREREARRSKEEKTKIISSPAARRGEEGGETVSLKTTLFCSLFFNMKRRRFGQNASFHLNKIWRQNTSISKSVLNLSFVHLSPQMWFWF